MRSTSWAISNQNHLKRSGGMVNTKNSGKKFYTEEKTLTSARTAVKALKYGVDLN
jgi:hypothetical protein